MKAMETLAKINMKPRYVSGYFSSNTIKMWKILERIISFIKLKLTCNYDKLQSPLKI